MNTDPGHSIVRRYLDAMRAGVGGVDEIVSLFAEDGVYVEPFSGQPQSHVGREAIRSTLSQSQRPPDLRIEVDRLETEGDTVVAYWTCHSPAFPTPMPGVDRYWIEDGLIRRLETRLAL